MPSTRLLRYLAAYRLRIVCGTLFLLGTNLFHVAIPWSLAHAIDAVRAGTHALAELRHYALLLALFAILQAGLRIASRVALFHVGRNVEFDLRQTLFHRLLGLSPAALGHRPTGELMSTLTSDLSAVRVMVGFGMLNVINTVFLYTLVLWRLFHIDARLTAVALLPYPALVAVGRAFGRMLHRQGRDVADHVARMSTSAQEDFSGILTVKCYGLEEVRGRAFETMCLEFVRKNMRLVRTRGLMGPLMGLLGALGTLVVLWAGGRLVISGRLTLGQFAAFHMYMLQLAWPTIALGFILSVWQRGMASWERLRELIATEPTLRDGPGTLSGPLRGELEVRGLSLELGGRRVLDGIDLHVRPGTMLAIVGRTGAGKSLLAEALARLLEVPPGTIFLDGKDVAELPLSAVRRAVGYAPQEAFLFSTTVRDNIELGRRAGEPDGMPIDRLVQATALKRDLAALPEGLDTVIGERGITLSGGQRQRVALARALAADARILILDDSLSSVDAETERDILEGLRPMLHDRTAIVISHRIAAVEQADEIVVLDEGRIVERGRHAELARRAGLYAALYERQLLERDIATESRPIRKVAD